ncbi:MAG: class I SAM-dependent methyltransferase [Granulosicoccus sp.]
MKNPIASKWNVRYAYSGEPVPAPAQVLSQGERWLAEIDKSKVEVVAASLPSALDLACGRASNGHWLAQRGYQVSVWDISETVIEEIRSREPCLLHEIAVRDISAYPPEVDSFDVIVVSRFLDRGICSAIAAALKPGGTLFYQTFTHGLSNPDYLLKPNELLSLFSELDILEYHEPEPDAHGKAEARLVARRSASAIDA